MQSKLHSLITVEQGEGGEKRRRAKHPLQAPQLFTVLILRACLAPATLHSIAIMADYVKGKKVLKMEQQQQRQQQNAYNK